MVLPRVVLTGLHELAFSIDADDDTLTDALARLVTHLRRSALSYTGLQLTIVSDGSPVTLTHHVGANAPPATSLRVAWAALVPESDGDSHVIFYAARPGAFVDLAADLSYALGIPTGSPRSPPVDGAANAHEDRAAIELDGDLALETPRSGLTGLAELSTINRAVGFLIGQGHLPEHAHEILRRGAAGAGVDIHVFAATLLHR